MFISNQNDLLVSQSGRNMTSKITVIVFVVLAISSLLIYEVVPIQAQVKPILPNANGSCPDQYGPTPIGCCPLGMENIYNSCDTPQSHNQANDNYLKCLLGATGRSILQGAKPDALGNIKDCASRPEAGGPCPDNQPRDVNGNCQTPQTQQPDSCTQDPNGTGCNTSSPQDNSQSLPNNSGSGTQDNSQPSVDCSQNQNDPSCR